MSQEILDDLDEIEGRERPIIFAKKAIIRARLAALIYALGLVTPFVFSGFGAMSTGKFIILTLVFSFSGLLAIFAVVNAVKSIIHKENALIKKSVALVIGIFVTYTSVISIYNYYLLLRFL